MCVYISSSTKDIPYTNPPVLNEYCRHNSDVLICSTTHLQYQGKREKSIAPLLAEKIGKPKTTQVIKILSEHVTTPSRLARSFLVYCPTTSLSKKSRPIYILSNYTREFEQEDNQQPVSLQGIRTAEDDPANMFHLSSPTNSGRDICDMNIRVNVLRGTNNSRTVCAACTSKPACQNNNALALLICDSPSSETASLFSFAQETYEPCTQCEKTYSITALNGIDETAAIIRAFSSKVKQPHRITRICYV